jgi:hypothetical protein
LFLLREKWQEGEEGQKASRMYPSPVLYKRDIYHRKNAMSNSAYAAIDPKRIGNADRDKQE